MNWLLGFQTEIPEFTQRLSMSAPKFVHRFSSAFYDVFLGVAALIMAGFMAALGSEVPRWYAAGRTDQVWGLAVMLSLMSLMLLFVIGAAVWMHVTRIEVDGDQIVYVSGRRRIVGSLKSVARLETYRMKGGSSYIVHFQDGRRFTISGGNAGARRLAAYVEQVSGKRFE